MGALGAGLPTPPIAAMGALGAGLLTPPIAAMGALGAGLLTPPKCLTVGSPSYWCKLNKLEHLRNLDLR
jgi:hypothetical protein